MRVVEAPTASDTRDRLSRAGPEDQAPAVAIRAWSTRTIFGDLGQTWDALLAGRCIDDHARLDDLKGPGRAKQLAAACGRLAGPVEPDAALVVGTSKGSVEDWVD